MVSEPRAYCPWRDRKGQSPAVRPQVAVANFKAARGSPAARAAACKGGRWQERLSQGRLPMPTACSVATYAG
ncbi:hypothetical protein BHM03_00020938 [Ensete ventricosum]|nr:hypothetical protein BHM03_00020938 [Ensete ventricosum]